MPTKKLKIIPLGGLGEFGMNCLALRWEDDIIVIDAGLMFPESELLGVDGVQWFQESADGLTTWYAVDRAAVVALTLPGNVGTGPIQAVSTAVSSTMPAVPVF